MRAQVALLLLIALGCTAACSADFGRNPSARCDQSTPCPGALTCYRGFCLQGPEVPIEVDGSVSPISEIEAGLSPDAPAQSEAGAATLPADAQSPAAPSSPTAGDGGPASVGNVASDAGPVVAAPASPADDASVQSPASPPANPPAVDPAPVSPAPTTPVTPAPTAPEPTTPAPSTPATPTVDAGAPEASVPMTPSEPTTPPVAEPQQSSPLLLCLAVCLTRSALCLTCLGGAITNDPTVCDERQVRGDRELRELCDWLCDGPGCGGPR